MVNKILIALIFSIFLIGLVSAAPTVTLNSPANGASVTSLVVTTNASTTSTLAIVNMSLYDNSTGSWGLRNTTTPNLQNVTQAHNKTLTDCGSNCENVVYELGVEFKARRDSSLTYAHRSTSSNTATARLYYSNGTNIYNTSSTTGQDFYFPSISLTTGTTYYLLIGFSTNYHDSVSSGATFPYVSSAINWTSGMRKNGATYTPESELHQIDIINVSYSDSLNTTSTWDNTYTVGQAYKWNVLACDNSSACAFAASNSTFSISTTPPTITLSYPTNTISYGAVNGTLQLNFTATDSNLDQVWYNYNGTNITIAGATSGVYNLSNITLSTKKNVTIYANDTTGNLNTTTFSWNYNLFANENTYNSETYETANETYTLNVTSSTVVSAATLIWNGTSYSATITPSGSYYILTRTIDMPASTGAASFYWNITNSNGTISSDSNAVTVSALTFANCNTSSPYINFSFRNETIGNESVTASFSSTWTYWLGSGAITKSLSFSNLTESNYRAFCLTPTNRTVYASPTIIYYNSYSVQRSYAPGTLALTNSTTNTTLYLLPNSIGLYVTFQVVNTIEQVVSGATINISRDGYGTAEVRTTDSSGTATFFLDPNYPYNITASKTGYTSTTVTITPTQSSYTIQLGGGLVSSNITDLFRGIDYSYGPSLSMLDNGTAYIFNFTLNSSYWDIDGFGFILVDENGTTIGSDSVSAANSGTATYNYTVGQSGSVRMNFYWIVAGEYANGSVTWPIVDNSQTSHSVNNFATRLKNYITNGGLFGLNDFGLNIIVFLIIFVSTGVAAYKFGFDRPALILGVMALMTFVFDVLLEFITYPDFIPIPASATIITVLMLIGSILYEVSG